ncbi:helix-turn-helix transcriptional regulator [Maribellus sp. CM-23]|uniref:helix-turn-helix domain-containing protein n=1 Tax=Maribellus sp. CM-23 TaxID=2781026 RepID=UPI001F1BB2EC|nr:helix-turn-helix transcriptional regulator [Maribellus sp. CM-23]MCE4566022.1 helix-turn-helix transcriptional regulator [Maribellus sp. CM-23]
MEFEQLQIRVGTKIKKLREEKGISQQDLAAMCNFEKGNMSFIESGTRNLTLLSLYKISKALGVDVKDLVDVG